MHLGFGLISGGTDNHLSLIDLRKSHPNVSGKDAQLALDAAHITTNKNTVPDETRSPFQASGIRVGTPAVTSRGMKELEMKLIAQAIAVVLSDPQNPVKIEEAKQIVQNLTNRFPLPY
jgi:glycine hydroxymethyltransferase